MSLIHQRLIVTICLRTQVQPVTDYRSGSRDDIIQVAVFVNGAFVGPTLQVCISKAVDIEVSLWADERGT